MRVLMFNWLVRTVGTVLGIWVADVVLPGVRLDGPPAGLFLATLLVVVTAVSVLDAVTWMLNRVVRWADEEEPEFGPVDSDTILMVVDALRIVIGLVVWTTLVPFALLLAARPDVGFAVDGYGTAVAAALTTGAVWPILTWPFAPAEQVRWELYAIVATLGSLATAVALVGDVRLEDGPGWARALVLTVLAMIYRLAWLEINIRFLTVAVRLASSGLKLWALTWLSTWMVTPLRIEGFWNFTLMAVLTTAMLWPLVLATEKRRDALRELDGV